MTGETIESKVYTDIDSLKCKRLGNGKTRCTLDAEVGSGKEFRTAYIVDELQMGGMGKMNMTLREQDDVVGITEGFSVFSPSKSLAESGEFEKDRILNCNVTKRDMGDRTPRTKLSCNFEGSAVSDPDSIESDWNEVN